MDKFGLQGNGFFFDIKNHLVHEGNGLAAILQQAFFFIARSAFAGIGFAVEIGVALQHMAPVFPKLGQHIRPGAYGPIVERKVIGLHAGLGVKLFRLPRHGCKEHHGQPVFELRVLAHQANA